MSTTNDRSHVFYWQNPLGIQHVIINHDLLLLTCVTCFYLWPISIYISRVFMIVAISSSKNSTKANPILSGIGQHINTLLHGKTTSTTIYKFLISICSNHTQLFNGCVDIFKPRKHIVMQN